jgi:hypothetical protein
MSNLLKQLVGMLVEAAVHGDTAVSSGVALYRRRAGKFTHYVMYDPDKFLNGSEDCILAYIQARQRSGECNDATEITASAAVKGYGPLLYDIVMSDSDCGIMSDRNSTSASAKNVWNHYATRDDVEPHPFDDKDDPKTPDPNDDCYLVDDPVLDQSYEGLGQADARNSMLKHHEVFMKDLPKSMSRSQVEAELFTLADSYFNSRNSK